MNQVNDVSQATRTPITVVFVSGFQFISLTFTIDFLPSLKYLLAWVAQEKNVFTYGIFTFQVHNIIAVASIRAHCAVKANGGTIKSSGREVGTGTITRWPVRFWKRHLLKRTKVDVLSVNFTTATFLARRVLVMATVLFVGR